MKKPTQTTHPVLAIAKAMRDAQRIGLKAKKLEERLRAYELPSVETADLVEQIAETAWAVGQRLNAVPATWKAAKGSVGKPIGKGDSVRLTTEAAKRYEGIVTAKQLFTVERLAGAKLVCVSQGSERVVLPLTRSSVQRVEA